MGTRREMDGKSHERAAREMGCSPLEDGGLWRREEALVMAVERASQKDTSHKLNKNSTTAVFVYCNQSCSFLLQDGARKKSCETRQRRLTRCRHIARKFGGLDVQAVPRPGILYAAACYYEYSRAHVEQGRLTVFLAASTGTEHDDASTYHEPNGPWRRYPISCTRTTDVSLLACPPLRPPSAAVLYGGRYQKTCLTACFFLPA
jgi:hypothetical protein